MQIWQRGGRQQWSRAGAGQCEAIRQRRTQREGGADNERQSGGGGRSERGGGQREAIRWWMTQREERGELRGPNAAADDMTIGGPDNSRHVACDGIPLFMIDVILGNSMPLFILRLTL